MSPTLEADDPEETVPLPDGYEHKDGVQVRLPDRERDALAEEFGDCPREVPGVVLAGAGLHDRGEVPVGLFVGDDTYMTAVDPDRVSDGLPDVE